MKPASFIDGKYQILSEINMIPLIDVALVLLIIFMIITPILVDSGIKVDLPAIEEGQKMQKDQKTVQVSISEGGEVFVNGKPIPAGDIGGVLSGLITQPNLQDIVIDADRKVQFQHFVNVVEAAQKTGVSKFGITVRQNDGGNVREPTEKR